MDLIENIILALEGLRANKMRAILTMLGIIIGIGSVIAIVTVGNSLTASITSTMEGLGANAILVSIVESSEEDDLGGEPPSILGFASATPEEEDLLTEDDIELFSSKFSDRVESVSLTHSLGYAQAQEGRRYANVSVAGVNEGYQMGNKIDLLKGRFISEKDIKSVKKVALVSDRLIENMFLGDEDPLGREIKIHSADRIETYIIIGVYRYEVSAFRPTPSSEKDLTTNFYIPISLAKQDSSMKNYQAFTIYTKTGTDAQVFSQDIRDYFSKEYEDNSKWKASVVNMESAISSMQTMLGSVSVAISVIAAISLLVGGIGVMNIMLVSVTERTREIGIRKALGARKSYIKAQFIVESVIICTIGGFIGIILGLILGVAGSALLGFPAKFSIDIIILSVSLTMLIGVFFGYYPANKAANYDPIEALRYE